jgi:hypothetical protein
VLYVKTDYISRALGAIRRRKRECVLITGKSDYSIGYDEFKNRPAQIKKWFAVNVDYEHPDLIPIPLGCENPKSRGYSGDMRVIQDVIDKKNKKTNLVMLNCNITTNVAIRQPIVDEFKDKDWVTYYPYGLKFSDCVDKMSRSKYIICPPGNGIDCHRVWEALAVGTIPIVQRSIHFEGLSDLPILIVDNFGCVDKMLLEESYHNIKASWNCEKATIQYWKKEIMHCLAS